MAQAKQLNIFDSHSSNADTSASPRRRGRPRRKPLDPPFFGGSLLGKGNPRGKRPLSTKKPIHVTMRSTKAVGRRSLLNRYASQITQSTLAECAKRSGVRIYRYQNVGNHIHLVIRLHHRSSWSRFIRCFTSLLKLRLEKLWREPITRLFDLRPFTRVGSWGREFRTLSDYVLKNYMDRWGIARTSDNFKQFKIALAVNIDPGEPYLSFRGPGQQLRMI